MKEDSLLGKVVQVQQITAKLWKEVQLFLHLFRPNCLFHDLWETILAIIVVHLTMIK